MANKPQPNFEFCKNYGENYKRLRTDKGLTQKELANALNMVHSTISDIEKSKNPPTIEQLQAYHKYFGVSYEYLLGETKVQNADLQLISEYTGLSEQSVHLLNEYSEKTKALNDTRFNNLIDRIFQTEEFYHIVLNCHGIFVSSSKYPSYTIFDTKRLSEKLGIPENVLYTHINDNANSLSKQAQAVVSPNNFKYDNIACINRISEMFDNTPDLDKCSNEEIMEYLKLTKEDIEKYSEK